MSGIGVPFISQYGTKLQEPDLVSPKYVYEMHCKFGKKWTILTNGKFDQELIESAFREYMQEHTVEECAEHINVHPKTVIRQMWRLNMKYPVKKHGGRRGMAKYYKHREKVLNGRTYTEYVSVMQKKGLGYQKIARSLKMGTTKLYELLEEEKSV